MSYTEVAIELRKLFKARGWNSRKVGVRSGSIGYSGEVNVTIKDPAVPYKEVKALASGFEHIDRCHLSHEILSGGNLFVDVSQSDERIEVLTARHLEAVKAAVAKIDGNAIEPITKRVGVGKGNWDNEIMLWIGDRPGMRYHRDKYGLEAAALSVALEDKDQAALAA